MPFYSSFPQVFVTNTPALLAEGSTVDNLAVGQIGILDAKTFVATQTPTYAKNKALKIVWGTPDITLGDFGGMPNENEYSKLIKGKLITGFRAAKAQRGQTPVYTLGWSGDVSDTDTLSSKVGERKSVFIKLSGAVIDRLYGTQGFIKEVLTIPACTDDCADNCADVLCPDLAYQIADQINSDKDLKKFIKAKAIVSCVGVTPPAEGTCYRFNLSICDTGDQAALGAVQASVPAENVSVASRNGSSTTYTVVKSANTAPAAFVGYNETVPDCGACPVGYTLQPAANVFTVSFPTGTGTPSSLPGYISNGTVVTAGGRDTYIVKVAPAQDQAAFIAAAKAVTGGAAAFTSSQKERCLLTTPAPISWVANGTLKNQTKAFRITVADDVCGVSRLADLQAAYPDLSISVVDASGSCVHTFTTNVTSHCYEVGCAIDAVVFDTPAIFEGAEWKAVPAAPLADGTVCKCGVQLETAFFKKNTTECTFNAFPYENDIVHIQVSNHNQDFNGDPCETDWVFKQIRQVKYPQGDGAFIRKLEEDSKAYDGRTRAYDAVVREAQGYSLQADPNKFYDQYTLEFTVKFFTSGGWSERYTESFALEMFVPEGSGSNLEAALNGYLASAGIDEEGVILP